MFNYFMTTKVIPYCKRDQDVVLWRCSGKIALRFLVKFTGKHLYGSLYFNKVASETATYSKNNSFTPREMKPLPTNTKTTQQKIDSSYRRCSITKASLNNFAIFTRQLRTAASSRQAILTVY